MTKSQSMGEGWDKLEEKVDSLVEPLMEVKSIPGMTVAVTKGGRLLLSKGYGYAVLEGPRKLPMKPCSRSRIGSVGKAGLTGPAGFQLMKAKNIDPKSQKLYGAKGLFGGMFDADIDIGIKEGIRRSMPNTDHWKEWYQKITIQNLLDHRAGFIGSGNTEKAATMFKVKEEDVTYEHVHRHFLRTKPIYEPGTTPSADLLKQLGANRTYSNHGFGLWTLLIKAMSGKSFPDYVQEDYLRPMKLHHAVRPERVNPDSCDAHKYKFNGNGKPEASPFKDSGTGLAAGGFTSSAQEFLRLTTALDKKYSKAELDSMGWGMSSGRLSHSGEAADGAAYATMFSEDYSNVDLRGVHIALATNIPFRGYDLRLMSVASVNSLVNEGHSLLIVALVGGDLHIRIFEANGKKVLDKTEKELTGGKIMTDMKTALKKGLNPIPKELEDKDDVIKDAMLIAGYNRPSMSTLATKIAEAVSTSNVPVTFDLWKQGKAACSCEYVRLGVPSNEYQQVFDEAAQAGYRLEWIDGYTDDGKVHLNVIFRTNVSEIAWVSHHNMTGEIYQQKFDEHRKEGFSLDHVDSYTVGNKIFYAAIWTKSGDALTAYHGNAAEAHQKSFDSLTEQGWRPKVISVASVDGKRHYTALYTKQSLGRWEARSFLSPEEYQAKFDENKEKGLHPHYLNSYRHEGTLRFSVIWAEKPDVSGWMARHGLTAEQFRTCWEDAMSDGFRTRAVTGYEEGGKVRYAAYWTK